MIMVVGMVCAYTTLALAETVVLKQVINATCKGVSSGDFIAQITVPEGWQVDFYAETGPIVLPVGVDKFSLFEGRRFNFVKTSTMDLPRAKRTYINITPTMVRVGNPIFGRGVTGDCHNPNGCAFMVTCQ